MCGQLSHTLNSKQRGRLCGRKRPRSPELWPTSLFSRPGSCQRVRRCVFAWTVGESQGIVAASAAVEPSIRSTGVLMESGG